MTKKKYEIKCPNCKSTFDCEKAIKRWREEIVMCNGTLDKIKEIVKEEK